MTNLVSNYVKTQDWPPFWPTFPSQFLCSWSNFDDWTYFLPHPPSIIKICRIPLGFGNSFVRIRLVLFPPQKCPWTCLLDFLRTGLQNLLWILSNVGIGACGAKTTSRMIFIFTTCLSCWILWLLCTKSLEHKPQRDFGDFFYFSFWTSGPQSFWAKCPCVALPKSPGTDQEGAMTLMFDAFFFF